MANCIHFRPQVNPTTGRTCPAQAGTCAWGTDWLATWPKIWPKAYQSYIDENPKSPRPRPVYSNGWADCPRCPCREEKPESPTAALERLFAEQGDKRTNGRSNGACGWSTASAAE